MGKMPGTCYALFASLLALTVSCKKTDLAPSSVMTVEGQLSPELRYVIEQGKQVVRFDEQMAKPFWPLDAYHNLPNVWGRPDIKVGSPEFYEEVFLRYGLHAVSPDANEGLPNDPKVQKQIRDNAAAHLPQGLVKTEDGFTPPGSFLPTSGRVGIVLNCEMCHSTQFHGRFEAGLTNIFSDTERLHSDLNAGSSGQGTFDFFKRNPVENSMVSGAGYAGRLGMHVRTPHTDGFKFKLSSLSKQAIDSLRSEVDQIVYVRPPAWFTFNLKRKKPEEHVFYADGGASRKNNFASFTYFLTFAQPFKPERLARALENFKTYGHEYIASTKPPRYRQPINFEMANSARGIYERKCGICHGGPGSSGGEYEYPGLHVPLEEVKTDGARVRYPEGLTKVFNDVLGPDMLVERKGYIAPPLIGIWARAPYLHNGSVPTLAQLLDSKTRIETYAIISDPRVEADYDFEQVGWKVVNYATREGKEIADGLKYRRPGGKPVRIYDKKRMPNGGLSNAGHTYGDSLKPEERRALLEFLKTL